ncbi:restriction endonuclease fold toxin 5 domain-containing protein [Xenorhabdus bovienii]|uniref:restriction endonuclease fold toxin 5 domain-containing protein n=1 Tax=Xenorhabdus bovienii TaxID=40576 RepID=UPI00237CEEB7|nr:restriction endonuclease fold toxin 5 domain-containing protein [Xenorhabdus bovienii]MDE1486979.1 restriction endonuclease fold toxin 5 domain-containing protein [Xenorhabdus bovienii]MDE1495633.1 restriction endonuclease fold toxin 5 domain-containing protein [Xenorhabdus bovienii]MDE9477821.1 restriction endonuclease fold toxin 5 domain-containing protein [Xenorhabdus bovienii]MDE9530647.1 restriction endonuclease fold toxin 5 domain-containing protein [Xenorhabdus bovienii]
MPLPLVFASPVLVAAAEYTLTALAGIAIGVGVGVGIEEATKDKEEDKAKTETGTIASSRTKCEECPAIGQVTPYWESVSISADSTIYQIQICNSVYMPEIEKIQVWLCLGVRFDGWKPQQCLFLEAKAKYDQFFENDDPKFWWKISKSGHISMMSQAGRQQTVCSTLKGIPNSHWHFLQPVSFAYYAKAFSIYANIKVLHTPL